MEYKCCANRLPGNVRYNSGILDRCMHRVQTKGEV